MQCSQTLLRSCVQTSNHFLQNHFSIPSSRPYTRNIWQYSEANPLLITRAISQFPWMERLDELDDYSPS